MNNIIELEEGLRKKTRENESLIKSNETLQVKTGIMYSRFCTAKFLFCKC